MTKKILLTATVQSHICQFHRPLVEVLHEYGYEVHVAARNNLAEKNGLKLDFVERVYDLPFSRSPKSPDNIKAYKELKTIIEQEQFEIIHCNTPVGGVVTRLAAKEARKHGTKVFYTAHGFHFYKGASKKNWAIFYPIEKVMAGYCDTLITVNYEDYELAKEKFSCRVEHIHGVGVDTNRYHPCSDEERTEIRRREGFKDEDFIVLCTGELLPNKNQKALIQASALLKDKIPNLKVCIAGNGRLEADLKNLVKELHLEDIVIFLGYRPNLNLFVPATDCNVACSFREGMPLNVIEALLCKRPVVVSHNRGHNELVEDGVNGYLVEPSDIEGFADRIYDVYQSKDVQVSFGENGYTKAQVYTAESVKQELRKIYGWGEPK